MLHKCNAKRPLHPRQEHSTNENAKKVDDILHGFVHLRLVSRGFLRQETLSRVIQVEVASDGTQNGSDLSSLPATQSSVLPRVTIWPLEELRLRRQEAEQRPTVKNFATASARDARNGVVCFAQLLLVNVHREIRTEELDECFHHKVHARAALPANLNLILITLSARTTLPGPSFCNEGRLPKAFQQAAVGVLCLPHRRFREERNPRTTMLQEDFP